MSNQESDGGKWVRYDENGHMIKGENCQNGNWYYFEPVTGAMIHGPWTLPDGRKVYYDLTTGIMQYGNVSINGSLYYFDPVYGTMKSGALTNFWVTDGNGKSFWYESWVRQAGSRAAAITAARRFTTPPAVPGTGWTTYSRCQAPARKYTRIPTAANGCGTMPTAHDQAGTPRTVKPGITT